MTRGFDKAEFQARLARAQKLMEQAGLAALLLTGEPEVRYFTGFLTRFWESPSRPWFLVLPAQGAPIAVIPSIGVALMSRTWIEDIRSWSAPDLLDDGLSLLAEVLRQIGGPIGLPMGHESHLRMPLADFEHLKQLITPALIRDDAGIIRALRMIKSEAEIDKIRTACGIAGRSFDRVGEIAAPGVPLSQVFREFQRLCLAEGADWLPYLAGGAGPLGYDDVISPASDAPLQAADVLMLDTGLVYDGYFCDYDRNFAIGPADRRAKQAWHRLMQATDAGRQAARPGATAAEVFHAMDKIVSGGAGGGDAGRLGHGLGMQLTEWPSLMAGDHTLLVPGMVLSLEPAIRIPGGGVMVHEDNIVIRNGPPEQLSPLADGDLPVI